jgi:hypothetical protein
MLTQQAKEFKALLKQKPETWPILEPPALEAIMGMYPQIFEVEMMTTDCNGYVVPTKVIPRRSQEYVIAALCKAKVL